MPKRWQANPRHFRRLIYDDNIVEYSNMQLFFFLFSSEFTVITFRRLLHVIQPQRDTLTVRLSPSSWPILAFSGNCQRKVGTKSFIKHCIIEVITVIFTHTDSPGVITIAAKTNKNAFLLLFIFISIYCIIYCIIIIIIYNCVFYETDKPFG